MSVGSDDAFPIASLCSNDETAPSSFDWLLSMLQQAMTEVMASDAAPLQKASALARLGALYLKAYRTAGLEQANKELARRIEALEARLAATEAAAFMERADSGETEGSDDTPIGHSFRVMPPLTPVGPDDEEADEPAEVALTLAAAPGRASP